MHKLFVLSCLIAVAYAMPGYHESSIPVVTKTVYHQPGTLVHGIPTIVKSYSSPTVIKTYRSSISPISPTVVRSHPTLSEW